MGYSKHDVENNETKNSRNGYSPKVVKTRFDNLVMEMLRDRGGEFNPLIIPRHQGDISSLEDKIIGLYARDLSTRGIHKEMNDL